MRSEANVVGLIAVGCLGLGASAADLAPLGSQQASQHSRTVQTMVPLRIANMAGCTFFVAFGALSGNVATFLLYLLMLPINRPHSPTDCERYARDGFTHRKWPIQA